MCNGTPLPTRAVMQTKGFDLELEGRRALVTGGTKGVGAAVVSALRDAGVRVVATARSVPADTEGVHYLSLIHI